MQLAAIAYVGWLVSRGVVIEITTGSPNPIGRAAALLFLPVMAALLVVRGRRASLGLLALAIAIPLVEALTRFR